MGPPYVPGGYLTLTMSNRVVQPFSLDRTPHTEMLILTFKPRRYKAGIDMRKRWGLVVIAGVILALLIAYPWLGCTIPKDQVQVSLNRRWAVVRADGSAVGLTFNITNNGDCDLHLEETTITLQKATYIHGSEEALEFSETQEMPATILPNEMRETAFTFDYIFPASPVKMTMRVEMVFREIGSIVVFDGETQIPYPS